MTINANMSLRDWTLLIILSVLWGGSFFFVEVAITSIPPLFLVLSRVALAAVALWAIAFSLGLRPPHQAGVWCSFFCMGMINNLIPFSLLAWGQTHIASGLAAILNATTPAFTVLVAGLLLDDERITPAKLAGVLIAIVGVIILIGPTALDGIGDAVLAQLAVLGAALSYALAGVYGRRFRRLQINPLIAAAGQVTASALVLAPIAFYFETPPTWNELDPEILAAIFALGLLSTALAYILYFRLLESAGAVNLLLVAFLIPISAILLGALVLGEILQAAHFIGMACIGCGLVAIDGRLLRYRIRAGWNK